MFSAFEWMMAARYLRARRREGFISIIAWFSLIGITLGVATLIIVMAVMNGFRKELLGRILGLNGHVVVQKFDGNIPDFDALVKTIAGKKHAVRVNPQVEGQVMAIANGQAGGGLVRGIRPEMFASRKILSGNLMDGKVSDFSGKHSVFVGIYMAQKMGLSVGSKITLVSPQSTSTPFGGVPRAKAYKVAGIFQVGMYEYDSTFIYMPLQAAQTFFRTGNKATKIQIFVDDPDVAMGFRAALAKELPGHRVSDWQQINGHFFAALQVERNVMFLILTLIILIAAFNIVSSLIMLVKDKSKAIAILRTMGATRGAIQRIFIIAGSSVGFIGTGIGFALGLSFCLNIDAIRVFLEGLTGTILWSPEIRFLSRIPADVNNGEVMLVLVMALGLSFLATLYPAWRAARLDPVEALRYE